MNTCCRWYKTDIKGAPEGKLKGKRLAIKDCVFLAGVPIINGSHLMSGFIPDQDATIITRMLDAGEILLSMLHFIYPSFYLCFILSVLHFIYASFYLCFILSVLHFIYTSFYLCFILSMLHFIYASF